MQDKMECNSFAMILKHSTSKFATKIKFKIYKPNKNSQFFLCVSTNKDINKLNWRFNHIFLVITNRDFLLYGRADFGHGHSVFPVSDIL